MPITLNSPIVIGTIETVRCNGFRVHNLYDLANATVELVLERVKDDGTVHNTKKLLITNGRALPKLTGGVVAEANPDNIPDHATDFYQNVILAAVGNPNNDIEAALISVGIVDGT